MRRRPIPEYKACAKLYTVHIPMQKFSFILITKIVTDIIHTKFYVRLKAWHTTSETTKKFE